MQKGPSDKLSARPSKIHQRLVTIDCDVPPTFCTTTFGVLRPGRPSPFHKTIIHATNGRLSLCLSLSLSLSHFRHGYMYLLPVLNRFRGQIGNGNGA